MSAGKYVHYEANATSTVSSTPTIALKACGKWDFQLHAVAPVLDNGWALLGEPSKWVPVSKARFDSLATADAVRLRRAEGFFAAGA